MFPLVSNLDIRSTTKTFTDKPKNGSSVSTMCSSWDTVTTRLSHFPACVARSSLLLLVKRKFSTHLVSSRGQDHELLCDDAVVKASWKLLLIICYCMYHVSLKNDWSLVTCICITMCQCRAIVQLLKSRMLFFCILCSWVHLFGCSSRASSGTSRVTSTDRNNHKQTFSTYKLIT